MEKWINKTKIFRGRFFTLFSGEVSLENGKTYQRDIIEHPGGVGIVPILNDSIVFIKQFRMAINREIVEIPAGLIEKNESPEQTARREIEEEIGYIPGRLIPLSVFYVSVGYTTEKIHLFIAENLKKTNQKLDFDESITTLKIKLADIPELLKKGWFEDSKTIIALQNYLLWYKENKK